VQPKVFYTWGETVLQGKYDPGFDKTIAWDIPLLDGYDYEFPDNIAADKGSHHYNGIINPQLIARISEWRPDAILVYGWKFKSHLKVIRHFHKMIPVWFRGDSTLLDEKKNLQSVLKKRLLKWVYGHIHLAFYTGTRNKDYFLKYGLQPHQLVKAFHAIDNERFQNINERYSPAAIDWKAKLEINPAALVFLFAGKLEPKKGVGTLLEAFKAISNDQVHLLVVGNGPLEPALKRKYEAESNVTFLDFQNQLLMTVVYCLCDVFVLPSAGPGETWGLAVNEAMAAGKPVIVSDKCGGAIDLVKDKVNGLICKAGDVSDLAEKMQTVIDRRNELPAWGKNSSGIVNKYSFASFVSVIENAMISLG